MTLILEHIAKTLCYDTAKQYNDPKFGANFSTLKRNALEMGRKCVFDFLTHSTANAQIGNMVDNMETIMTFSDSYYSFCSEYSGESILIDLIKKIFL